MHTQSIDDIMQKAIDLEKEGANFYRKLAAEVSIEAVRDVFLKLVNDETQHQKDFAALAKTMRGVVIVSSLDLIEIMTAVTTKLRDAMKGSELIDMRDANLGQALNIGIHNEQEAIRSYAELLKVAHPGFNAMMERVIGEEQDHLKALVDMKNQRLG